VIPAFLGTREAQIVAAIAGITDAIKLKEQTPVDAVDGEASSMVGRRSLALSFIFSFAAVLFSR
jgi:hypothetical protein